jgi:N-acetylmuramoyl-L-alanine amidase
MQTEAVELANVIYHEARGESRAGQVAVGHVVMNRVKDKRFPKTVKGVVWQSKQFSNIRYHVGYTRFLDLAKGILAGKVPNPVGNSLYFASNRSGKGKIRIGNHVFW